ncbi:MAG TPA: endoribonuclease MazF [Longimicrobiaceae bacterium]|nr:endoribonuclease MazF [Longimicrobiaceae bacterium]
MVTSGPYVPQRGDLVWLDFDPQAGHEQAGRRPALVLSPVSYNRATRLALLCPVTSKIKGYSFEVSVTGKKVNGVVLADQVKSLDWSRRNASFIERSDAEVIDEVLAKLGTLTEY